MIGVIAYILREDFVILMKILRKGSVKCIDYMRCYSLKIQRGFLREGLKPSHAECMTNLFAAREIVRN